ncbi:hypothetical protein FDP41_007271 [Naegleria fowleri]|uniref:Autophagy-related protein 11 C-terminal domain-containing protein n=1 Tax=Naegleria fowleri TaxID=5763 RepID=A0A6A5BIJ4_NAEFO|nr:uncharacterized protein FDP41_007271 [Naegleria fowleri]KAF0973884.1 hypothetical protein FDP41_007271 [Naegleria fowleri]CAG4708701.1 unnamed protein product [Naegleria fowleri]
MVIQTYHSATGEQLSQDVVSRHGVGQEGKIIAGKDKEILPFLLSHDETTRFLYVPNEIKSSQQSLNSQPPTLQSMLPMLVDHNSIASTMERVDVMVNECRQTCQVTESRWNDCEDRKQKRSIVQLAKETLINFIKNTMFANYCKLVEEETTNIEKYKSVIQNVTFEDLFDNLTQTKTVNESDLMRAMQLDENSLRTLINTAKSYDKMVSIQQNCKNIISKQINELSREDNDITEELQQDLISIESVVKKQKEALDQLLVHYEQVKQTNDELQYINFEYTAQNKLKEIVGYDNQVRESQCLYVLRDYELRNKLNQQMEKMCSKSMLTLMVNTTSYFNQAREGGSLEKLVFLVKLPDIISKLFGEIKKRKESFTENSLIKNFRIFTDMIRTSCEDENQRREKSEQEILSNLNETQVTEVRFLIPGVIGDRIQIEAVTNGLRKLERSIARTIDINLPQETSKLQDEYDDYDFFVISKRPQQSLLSSESSIENMTNSVMIDYAINKANEGIESFRNSSPKPGIRNEQQSSLPDSLYQSYIDDDQETNNKINALQEEISALKQQIIDNAMYFSKEKEEHQRQIEEANSRCESMADENNRLNSLLAMEQEQRANETEQLKQEISMLKETLEGIKKYAEEKDSIIQQNATSCVNVENQNKTLQERLIKLATQVQALNSEVSFKNDQNNQLTMEKEKLLNELEMLKEAQSQLTMANHEKEQQFMDLMLNTRQVEESKNQAIEESTKLCNNLKNELSESRQIIATLQQEMKDAQENSESKSQVLELLQKQLESKDKEVQDLVDQLNRAKLAEETKEKELEALKKAFNEKHHQNLQETNNVEKLEQQLLSRTNEYEKKLQEIRELESQLNATKLQIEQLCTTNDELSQQVKEQKEQLARSNASNTEVEKLKKEVKELSIKAHMYETAALKGATLITSLQTQLQQNQQKLKEQEESFKVIQEEYTKLEKSYLRVEEQNKQPSKTFVSLEPEVHDMVIFYRNGQSKDLFSAISKNPERIYIAPESLSLLKSKYSSSFDSLSVVVGKIVYIEQASSHYNPLNLQGPYSIAYIEEVM